MTVPADSAGVPWSGRTLTDSPFAGDDGSVDPRLGAALAARGAGGAGLTGRAGRAGGDGDAEVVRALATARLLVPVVAVVAETETAPESGLAVDQAADMALVMVAAPDGRTALPVFSALQALTAWRPDARPVPVEAARAALSALSEGCQLLVLDPGGPHPFVVPRPAVVALAQGRAWVPSYGDPDVQAAVTAAATADPAVRAADVERGRGAELRVVLHVVPGLDRAALDRLVAGVGQRLAADAVVAERVDGVELRVVPG